MEDNYAVKSAMKGVMAGLRGIVEGKLAVKQAQTAKALKEAEINLDNKRFNMERAQAFFEEQRKFAKEGRDAIESENKQAAMKAEEERAKQLHEQQQGIRTRLDAADTYHDGLYEKLAKETDPEKQAAIREDIALAKKERAYLSDRLGESSSSLSAEIKSESDEAAAVAEDKRTETAAVAADARTEAAAVAEHTRTLETETKEKEAADKIQADLTIKQDKFKADLDVWEPLAEKSPEELTDEEKTQLQETEQAAKDSLFALTEAYRQADITIPSWITNYHKLLQVQLPDAEGGTEQDRLIEEVKEIEDEGLQSLILESLSKGLPARTAKLAMAALVAQAKAGRVDKAYDMLGDLWIAASPSEKVIEKRFTTAYMYQEMRIKLQELEAAGVQTGRVTQSYIDAMGRKDFSAAAKAFSLEFLGQDYTEEQKRLIGEVHAFINSEFKQFLLLLSGTASSDSEVEFVQSMFPSTHADKSFSIGIIDGHLDSLRKQEFAFFLSESDKETANRIMKQKGWDEIKKSTYKDWSKMGEKHKIGIVKAHFEALEGDVEETIQAFEGSGLDTAEVRKIIEGFKKDEEK